MLRVEQVTQEVHADRSGPDRHHGRELGAADQREMAGSGLQRGLPTAGVVVIGDRQHVNARTVRGGHQLSGRVRAVRGGRVRVQVDDHRDHPARRRFPAARRVARNHPMTTGRG